MEIYIRFKRKNGDIDYYCINFPKCNDSTYLLYNFATKIFKNSTFQLYHEKEFIIPDENIFLHDILKDGDTIDYIHTNTYKL